MTTLTFTATVPSADVTPPSISSVSYNGTNASYTLSEAATVEYLFSSSATTIADGAAWTAAKGANVTGTLSGASGANTQAVSAALLTAGTWYLHMIGQDASGNRTATSAVAASGYVVASGSGEPFTTTMWTVQPSGTSGEIYLNIKSKPTAEAIYQSFECRINGGTPFVIAAGVGAQNITGLNNGVSNTVEIRTTTRAGVTSAWDSKTVTPVADTRTVLTTSTFAAALASATSGSRLYLAAGSYGVLSISGKTFDPPLIIRADNQASPPTFTYENIANTQGVTLRDIAIKWNSTAADMDYSGDGVITGTSKYISYIDGSHTGDVGKNTTSQPLYVGFPIGRGLTIGSGVVGVMFLRHTATTWGQPHLWNDCSEITEYGCTVSNFSNDGHIATGIRGVLLDGTTIKDLNVPDGSPAHIDCFQTFHQSAARVSQNVCFRNNIIHTGAETELAQGFFFGHEDYLISGRTTYNIPQSNFFIENNLIYSGHNNAIVFYAMDNFTCKNNTLIRNKAVLTQPAAVPPVTETDLEPHIFFDYGTNGVISANVARQISAASGSVTVSGNLLIQHLVDPNATASPYGYNTVFYDANADGVAEVMAGNCPLANIKAKAGSVIYTGSYGASVTRP